MLGLVDRFRRKWSGGSLKLFWDYAVLSGGHVGSKVIGFFVFAFLARTLRPDAYGAVEYIVGLSVVFATFVESGLGVVGVRRIAARSECLPVLAAQIPVTRFILALISMPLLMILAVPAMQSAAARGLALLFAVSLVAGAWRQDWLLQGTQRMNEAAVAQLLYMVVFAVVVVSLVRDPMDAVIVGWAEIAAVSATSLYGIAVQHAKITPFRLRAPIAGMAGVAREGALVGLGNSVWAASQYAPLMFVAATWGGPETAWFAAANRVVGSLMAFSYLYHFNLYPTIARATMRDADELVSILTASFRVVAWASTFAALALTLLAEPLSVLLFGEEFRLAAPVVMILAWTLPIAFLSGHARWALIAAGQQSRVLYAQLAGFIVITASGVPLVFLLGGRGAALASIAAFITVWLAAHVFSLRDGGRLPRFVIALVPGSFAVLVIGGIHVVGIDGWSAGTGVILFAVAAPLLDRRLVPDLGRLGAARSNESAVPHATA